MQGFFAAILANLVGTAFAANLVVSALAFLVFAYVESRRLGLAHFKSIALATVVIGLSFAMPLFLYLRARHLRSRSFN